TLYRNDGGTLPAAAGRVIETTRHAVNVGGADYTLVLTQDATERRAAEDALFELAYFDELTHLPNRRLIETLIARLIA
ncbi:GGDEF domain-containing protein, partial [Mycobacterium tuberculosis]|nr:GGDEF domain-containing protein [Mycobacterium tuberculosis]